MAQKSHNMREKPKRQMVKMLTSIMWSSQNNGESMLPLMDINEGWQMSPSLVTECAATIVQVSSRICFLLPYVACELCHFQSQDR